MATLSNVSETLFVPLAGRIYATRKHPDIFRDDAAAALADRIPESVHKDRGQDEYTYLASAVRSREMDHYVRNFLREHPDGAVVNAGCGLETLCGRNGNGRALWFELDLPEVLDLRRGFFPEGDQDRYLPYSMFDSRWIEAVKEFGEKPVLVVASGLFHYFTEDRVLGFVRSLSAFPRARIVFDGVSSAGLKMTRRFMEKMGRTDALMHFSVDDDRAFARKVSPNAKALPRRPFYGSAALARGLKASTRMKMVVSDLLDMVKVVHLSLD